MGADHVSLHTIRRIEDNVIITKTGCDNLTTIIKDADELEKLISSS